MEENVSYAVQHKSYICKEMFICTTAYLPQCNDITKGGLAFKVSMERVGYLLAASRDSCKRIYNDNNTSFTYPKIPENLIRKKGELYFKSLEINAVGEGTPANPKFSLMKYFQEKEIPRLEALTRQLQQQYNKQIIIRYQMDGAGPHTDKKLQIYLDEQFFERNWMLVQQPPQSPLTNVKDTCLFPSLSRRVTFNQSNLYNSKVLDGEELNSCVM